MVRAPGYIFISSRLASLSGTPKRQRGRRAQQARAVVAVATAVVAAATATTTTPTTTTITAPTPIPTAAATAGAIPVDDDNPFLVASLYGQLVEPISRAEWPSQASQLEDQLRTLSICSPASRRANHMSPEVSPVRQKGRKDAQDVRAFFQQVNERWNCKFCEYVFHLSRTL